MHYRVQIIRDRNSLEHHEFPSIWEVRKFLLNLEPTNVPIYVTNIYLGMNSNFEFEAELHRIREGPNEPHR